MRPYTSHLGTGKGIWGKDPFVFLGDLPVLSPQGMSHVSITLEEQILGNSGRCVCMEPVSRHRRSLRSLTTTLALILWRKFPWAVEELNAGQPLARLGQDQARDTDSNLFPPLHLPQESTAPQKSQSQGLGPPGQPAVGVPWIQDSFPSAVA